MLEKALSKKKIIISSTVFVELYKDLSTIHKAVYMK